MSQSAEEPPTSNVMEVLTYSQVVFIDVPPSYIPNTPVKCSYKVTAGVELHRRDWVGIFKVGWSTTRDYYTFVWAAPSSNPVGEEPVELNVIFDAYYLPKEDGEFYQFCFVDSSGQVRGASTPYRFESLVDSSLDFSMDNDLLVITTQEQVEKEKEELHREMDRQKETIETLRAELSEKELEIKRLTESNEDLGQSVSQLEQERELWKGQQENEKARREREKQALVSQQGLTQEPVAQGSVDLEELQREKAMLLQSVSTWQDKYEQLRTKTNQLKQEHAELKEKTAAQEAEITQLSLNIREMEQEKQQNVEELQKQRDRIILLQVDLQSSQKESAKLAEEAKALHAQAEAAEGLRHENQALQRTLSEQDTKDGEDLEKSVQCDILAGQLQEVKEELRKERRSSEESRVQTDRALQELHEAKEKLEDRLRVCQEKDHLSSEQEKRLIDLHKTLDEEVNMSRILRDEKEKLTQSNQELNRTIEQLSEELANLKALPASSSISFQHPNPYSLPSVALGRQNPGADPLLYGNPFETPAASGTEELLMVCRYCQEMFPDISKSELVQHEESHKVCPFCTLICDLMDQRGFEEHVYGHE